MTRFTTLLVGVALALSGTAAFGQFLPDGGVDQDDADLPPEGVYLSPTDVHAMYSGPSLDIVLQDIAHKPFRDRAQREQSGSDELETFDSQLDGQVSVNEGPFMPITLTGQVQVVTAGKWGQSTGTFDTEMISMNLTGTMDSTTVMIRESLTQSSAGQTMISDIGGGQFHVDSFFDVWTELSVDGGSNWIPQSSGPTRVNLVVPEPASMTLLAVGGLAAVARRRRNR